MKPNEPPSWLLWHPDEWQPDPLKTLQSRMVSIEAAMTEDPGTVGYLWLAVGNELAHNGLFLDLAEAIARRAMDLGEIRGGAELLLFILRQTGRSEDAVAVQGVLAGEGADDWATPILALVESGAWSRMSRDEKRQEFQRRGLGCLGT